MWVVPDSLAWIASGPERVVLLRLDDEPSVPVVLQGVAAMVWLHVQRGIEPAHADVPPVSDDVPIDAVLSALKAAGLIADASGANCG